MTASEWAPHYSPDPNILERRAGEYLQAWPEQAATRRDEAMTEVRRLERRAILWAVLAGTMSGALIGGAEAYMRLGLFGGDLEDMGWGETWPYWTAFYVLVGVVSAIEIGFLYWNSLNAIGRAARLAGTDMAGGGHGRLVASGLARAALEFPNPRVSIRGIDPYALVPGWRLAVKNLLYKVKVGASSFILRVVLRRVLARAALRGFIPLLAIPLYAVWNGIITWRIMREARVRALGPLIVETALAHLPQERDETLGRLILEGSGEMMMRGRDAHPNYFLLLSRLVDAFGIEDETIEVDWDGRLRAIKDLSPEKSKTVLVVMTHAALLAGRMRSGQARLLEETYEAAGRKLDRDALKQLRTKAMNGEDLPDDVVGAVAAN